MFTLRKSKERGHTKLTWLDSWHTFSFDTYYDPVYEHFGPLRVINDDLVAPGAGFPTHSHRNMEILTYVLKGELEHKDSLGNGSVIIPGELQYMSAGKGIQHSEYNPSPQNPVHLLQIWIMPNKDGLTPAYDQKAFDIKPGSGWQLIASGNGSKNSIRINQDVALYATKLNANEQVQYKVKPNRKIWLHVAEGSVLCNNTEMLGGDSASLIEESALEIKASSQSNLLLFDLAK